MDYRAIAIELLDIRAKLMQMPTQKSVDQFTKGEFAVLDSLRKSQGNAYPKELSRNMNVSSARIAAILKSLEAKGLVTRTTDDGNAKQIVVTLTESGRDVLLEKWEAIISSATSLLEKLGEEDAVEFLRIQKKILDNA